MKKTFVLVVMAVIGGILPAHAQPPSLLHIQGRLAQGENLVNGPVELSLRLFDAHTGGSMLLEDSNTVTVVDGLYGTYIGDQLVSTSDSLSLSNPSNFISVTFFGNYMEIPGNGIDDNCNGVEDETFSSNRNHTVGQTFSIINENQVLDRAAMTIALFINNDSAGCLSTTIRYRFYITAWDQNLNRPVGPVLFSSAGITNFFDDVVSPGQGAQQSFKPEVSGLNLSLAPGMYVMFLSTLEEGGDGNLVNRASILGQPDAYPDGKLVFKTGGSLTLNGVLTEEWSELTGFNPGEEFDTLFELDFVGSSSLSEALNSPAVWLETMVNGVALLPRERVVSAPFAVHASSADSLSGLSASAFATGTPVYAESDPVWAAASNQYYLKSEIDTMFSTGMPVYVESDPVWTAEKAGYATGTPLYVEVDPIWNVEKSGYATGTPLYAFTEVDPLWAAASNAVQSGLNAIESDLADEATARTLADAALSNELSSVWSLEGNAGTSAGVDFIGTTDDRPLEFRVNNQRVALFYQTSGFHNVILGSPDNAVSNFTFGATIGGGRNNRIGLAAVGPTIAGGQDNVIDAEGTHSTIGGGRLNRIGSASFFATIPGGDSNRIAGQASAAVIGGGANNSISNQAFMSVIVGGQNNTIASFANHSTILGGRDNLVAGLANHALAAGRNAKALTPGSFVWASGSGGDFGSTADNQFLIRAPGGVGIGTNQTTANGLTIDGGMGVGLQPAHPRGLSVAGNAGFGSNVTVNGSLTVSGQLAAAVNGGHIVSGTISNSLIGANAAIEASKIANTSLTQSTLFSGDIAGLFGNLQIASGAVGSAEVLDDSLSSADIADGALTGVDIADGSISNADIAANTFWEMDGNSGAPTNAFIGTLDEHDLVFKVNNLQGLRLTPKQQFGFATNIVNVVAGAPVNTADGMGVTISGGGAGSYNGTSFPNIVAADFGTVSGGRSNTIAFLSPDSTISGGRNNSIPTSSRESVVAGGSDNQAGAVGSVISGGRGNSNTGMDSTVSGGTKNHMEASQSVIAGGQNNVVTGSGFAVVGGGFSNRVTGSGGTVPGGIQNEAASLSFAAGRQAKAIHTASFVWSDDSSSEFSTATNNQFLIRASGGVGINTNATTPGGLTVAGPAKFGLIEAQQFSGSAAGLTNFAIGSIGSPVILDNSITSGDIADGTISNIDLAVSAVDSATILNGSVTTADLALNAVTSDRILDGAITAADVASNTFWNTTGNADTSASHFIGTTDNRPLEIRVGGLFAGRITPSNGAPNIILGAAENVISSDTHGASILGGSNNIVATSSSFATIAGGEGNNVADDSPYATIAGGSNNGIEANSLNATIGGGENNAIESFSQFSVIPGGVNNLIAGAGSSVVGGGSDNTIAGFNDYATIAGGFVNLIGSNSTGAVIGGGLGNRVFYSLNATVGGGLNNEIRSNSFNSVVGSGESNIIGTNSPFAVIPGGRDNNIGNNATNAFAAGRRAKANHRGSFVWADDTNADFATTANNQFLIRASGGVGIGTNVTTASGLNVVGRVGLGTVAPDSPLHVVSGDPLAPSPASGSMLILERTGGNYISMLALTNSEQGILFGDSTDSVEGGITFNSFGITNGLQFRTGNNNARMTIDSSGRVGIGTTTPTNLLHVVGTVQATAYITGSDRNMKENIQPVEPQAILEKVAALPIATWTFREEPNGTHIGPMAQDFHATFGFGNTDTGIMTVDADGVALAAIQALVEENRKLREELDAIKRKLGM